jgi:hypothetical protein
VSAGLGSPSGPPQHGTDAREKLVEAEGLGDVVVGARIETADTIRFVGAGGDHDDGDVTASANLTQQFEAVEARQAHVEKQQVVPPRKRFTKTEVTVVHRVQAHAVVRQHLAHHPAQAFVIVYQGLR